VRAVGDYAILGESIDDAAGEAFDKTAKLLNLGYPGGPAIERAALNGRPGRYRFPRPMVDRAGLDFSFSGLKTAAVLAAGSTAPDAHTAADIAAEFQQAVIETLLIKTERALAQTRHRSLVVAGGVSANQVLRQLLERLAARLGVRCYFPRPEFCTDNGAMIAFAGCRRLMTGQQNNALGFGARPRWPLSELCRSNAGG
jgi:N6-L-threonylcarbamoyladenine synthase